MAVMERNRGSRRKSHGEIFLICGWGIDYFPSFLRSFFISFREYIRHEMGKERDKRREAGREPGGREEERETCGFFCWKVSNLKGRVRAG